MKVLAISFVLAVAGSVAALTGRIKTTNLQAVPVDRTLHPRKALVITGATLPTTDPSVYTRTPSPPGNFVFKVPPPIGVYPPVMHTVDTKNSFQPTIPQAQVQILNQRGNQVVQMPTPGYQQLFDLANSNTFATQSSLANGDAQNKMFSWGQKIGTKVSEKAGALADVGATLLGNTIKVQNGLITNAQDQYVNVYAAQKNAELAEAAGTSMQNLQRVNMKAIQNDPMNTVTPAIGNQGSMLGSTYASGYRQKI